MDKLEADIKTIARGIIQGNEKRKKRIEQKRESDFDRLAVEAIENALESSCANIKGSRIRKQIQGKIYQSIVTLTPYEYIGEVCCGRRQFYEYRNQFIREVAYNLGMLPLDYISTRKENRNKE